MYLAPCPNLPNPARLMNTSFTQSVSSKKGGNALGTEKCGTKAAHISINLRPGHNNNHFASLEEKNKTKGFFSEELRQ